LIYKNQHILSKVSLVCIGLALLVIVLDLFVHRPISQNSSVDKVNTFISSIRENTDEILSRLEGQNKQQLPRDILPDAILDISKPSYFVFKRDSLVHWTNPFPAIESKNLNELEGSYYSDGITYYHYSAIDKESKVSVLCILPLNQHSTTQLSDWILFNSGSKYNLEITEKSDLAIQSADHKNIIFLKILNRVSVGWTDWVLGTLYWALLIYCLIYLYYLLFRSRIRWNDIVLFGLIGFGLKLSLSSLTFFNRFQQAEVFSNEFGINWWIPSIADLSIFSIVIFLTVLAISKSLSLNDNLVKFSKYSPFVGLIFICICGLSIVKLIQKVILKSTIPFNIEQVFHVDLHTVLSIGSLLLLVLGFFIFSHSLYRSFIFNKIGKKKKLWTLPLSVLLVAPLVYVLHLNIPIWIYVITFTSFFILLDLFVDATKPSITWLIWWMIIIGGIVAIILYKYRGDSDKQNDLRFLQTLSHKVDIKQQDDISNFQQNLLPNLLDSITSMPYPFKLSELDILRFLKTRSPAYNAVVLNNDITVKCYDRFGRSMIEQDLSVQQEILQKELYAQIIDHGFFFDPFYNEYILNYEIEKANHPGAPFQLYFCFKSDSNYFPGAKNKPPNLQLLIRKNNQLVYTDNLELQKIATALQAYVASEDKTHFLLNGYQYSYLQASNDTVLIGRRAIARLIKPISLFSYIFTLLGLLIVALSILNSKFHFLPIGIDLNILGRTSLRNRIQLSVVMLIILSFIIIGLVTVYYFKTLSNNFSRNELIEKTIAVNSDLNYTIETEGNEFFALQKIQRKISQLQFVHQRPIVFYNSNTELAYSIDQKQNILLLNRLPLTAQQNLSQANYQVELSQFRGKQNETFLQSFSPIYLNKDQLLGYISLVFSPDTESRIDVNDFMGALLNVYVFLFLIAGAIAIAVANSITLPIAELGEKLRRVKLGKRNEPLAWKSKDELGELIEEYNRMIEKLDESAMLLAKTERDLAWREMAKQVAHEIKNPLTPMKLSIQYLKKAVKNDKGASGPLIQQVSNTLIEQIDNLSQIANEFSNFAKLPQARNEKIILNEVVETIHDLFRKREDMDFLLHEPIDELFVFADRNQLIRILNNIVKNATQAIPEDKRGKIEVNLYKEEDKAIIQITDNGAGIPEDMRDKVFSPYFTTKSSGTGLGLAIAANMIDSCNGKIYFSSKEDVGTDFFIEIPLMRLENNFPKNNRVNLDDV
jgi:signal transduction histidine kinase/membrane protein implicated in regulation of membrane protease activity